MTKVINEFPNYSINTEGEVINTKTNKTKQAWLGKNGYLHVDLFHNGTSKKIALHRLLALHFIPNPENKRTVNHIDGNKLNNALSNLEWATDSQNIKHAYDNNLNHCSTKKITNEAMDEILVRFFNHETLTHIMKDYSFSLPTLSTYLEEYTKTIDQHDKFIAEKQYQKHHRAKNIKHTTYKVTGISVQDPTDIRTFDSLSKAAKTLGYSSSGPISNVLAGRQKTAYGFTWIRS